MTGRPITYPLIFAFGLAACSTPEVDEPIGTKADAVETHARILSIDFCNWEQRPTRSLCYVNGLTAVDVPAQSGTPCAETAEGQFTYDFSREYQQFIYPRCHPPAPISACPVRAVYQIVPEPTAFGPYPKRTYPDGNEIYRGVSSCKLMFSDNSIHHTSTYFSSGFYRDGITPLPYLVAIYGTYDYIQTDNVRINASYEFQGDSPVVVALQTQDDAGEWRDRATRSRTTPDSVYESFDVPLSPFTPFRVLLRTGAGVNGSQITLHDINVVVPECVPDANNPGQCL